MQKPSFWHDAAAAAAAQHRCDIIQAQFPRDANKRPWIRREPPPTPRPLAPTDDLLLQRIAEELEYARRTLGVLGDELASDGAVVVRHSRSLQSIDILSQTLGHLAAVVGCREPEEAVSRIGMVELKARIQRKKLF